MSGVRLVYNNLPRIGRSMEQNVGFVVRTAAYRVEQESKASMTGPKHGRLYTRSKGGITHRASAPGEAPAVDTGALRNSISVKMVKPTHAQVIANQRYARILEKRRNRKFFKPAVEKIREWFVNSMIQALGRAK